MSRRKRNQVMHVVGRLPPAHSDPSRHVRDEKAIVSTSKGLMTDHQARKEGVGGELICYIW